MQALAREVADMLADLNQQDCELQAELQARTQALQQIYQQYAEHQQLNKTLHALLSTSNSSMDEDMLKPIQIRWIQKQLKVPILHESNWEEAAEWLQTLESRVQQIEGDIEGRMEQVKGEIVRRQEWAQEQKERLQSKQKSMGEEVTMLSNRLKSMKRG